MDNQVLCPPDGFLSEGYILLANWHANEPVCDCDCDNSAPASRAGMSRDTSDEMGFSGLVGAARSGVYALPLASDRETYTARYT
jgi:hypothetical protein